MNVVVTGGAGYIGSVLVPMLLAKGHQVTVLDSLLYGGHGLLPLFIHPHFSFFEQDIRDREGLARHLKNAEVVIHLAALVGYPLCKKKPREAIQINLEGAKNILDLTSQHTRTIYASTGSNYGEVQGICTEDTPLNPLSLYGQTKTDAERLFVERENSVSLRFATAFGLSPRLRLDLMLNDFTWQAIHQKYLVVYEKHFRRTFIHVRDIARAIIHVMEPSICNGHRVFNVGNESLNYTKEDIINLLQQRLQFLVHFAEIGKDADRRDYEVDYSRIRATGFQTTVDIESGLQELIDGLATVKIKNPYSNV